MNQPPLTDAQLRTFGKALRSFAHPLAKELRRILQQGGLDIDAVIGAAMQSEEKFDRIARTRAMVPILIVAASAAILLDLPRSKRGRTRKASTDQAMELLARGLGVRAAAREAAQATGEDAEKIRAAMRGLNRDRKGGKKLR